MISSGLQAPFGELILPDRKSFGALISAVYYFNSFFSIYNRRIGYMPKLFRRSAHTPFHSLHAVMDKNAAKITFVNHALVERLPVDFVCNIGVKHSGNSIDFLFIALLEQLAVAVIILNGNTVSHCKSHQHLVEDQHPFFG